MQTYNRIPFEPTGYKHTGDITQNFLVWHFTFELRLFQLYTIHTQNKNNDDFDYDYGDGDGDSDGDEENEECNSTSYKK